MARTVPVGYSGADPISSIGRLNYIEIICPDGAVAAVDSQRISNNTGIHQGQMVGWKVSSNNTTNGITYTVRIKDRDGDIIYASAGGHADNSVVVVMGLNVPLIEREIISILPSGDPGASTLIAHVTLYYNPDADIIAWGYR